jgi:hypothetical protein
VFEPSAVTAKLAASVNKILGKGHIERLTYFRSQNRLRGNAKAG